MTYTKYEVSKNSYDKIKKLFHNYVFNAPNNGRYFVKLTNAPKIQVLKRGMALKQVKSQE